MRKTYLNLKDYQWEWGSKKQFFSVFVVHHTNVAVQASYSRTSWHECPRSAENVREGHRGPGWCTYAQISQHSPARSVSVCLCPVHTQSDEETRDLEHRRPAKKCLSQSRYYISNGCRIYFLCAAARGLIKVKVAVFRRAKLRETRPHQRMHKEI